MRSRTLLLVLSLLLAVGGAQPQGNDEPKPLRVLFVGNSLTATNDLPAVVATLARSRSLRDRYRTIAPGGVSLEDHWAAGTAAAELDSGAWDAIVMQQGPSSLPESQVNLREWAVVSPTGPAPSCPSRAPHRVARVGALVRPPGRHPVVQGCGEGGPRRALPGRSRLAGSLAAKSAAAALRRRWLPPEPARTYLTALVVLAG